MVVEHGKEKAHLLCTKCKKACRIGPEYFGHRGLCPFEHTTMLSDDEDGDGQSTGVSASGTAQMSDSVSDKAFGSDPESSASEDTNDDHSPPPKRPCRVTRAQTAAAAIAAADADDADRKSAVGFEKITSERLAEIVEQTTPDLRSISRGQLESTRHALFLAGGTGRLG